MHKQPHRSTHALLALTVWLTACNGRAPAPEPQSQAPVATATTLTREQLGNLSYPSELGPNGRVQLKNGVFEAQEAGDPTAHLVVRLTDHMAEGDLDGDGRSDAAVILESDSGGSGSFMDLAAVLNKPNGPESVAVTDLGDRTEIRHMAFADGKVRIELIGHGPDDPVCCPTQVQQREYHLEGHRWVPSERRAPP
ncbi:MAG: hypothetical protein ABW110_15810 [Steroidobacteraceae bacterium]